MTFYGPQPEVQADALSLQYRHPGDAALLYKLAAQPAGIWLGGWSGDITTTVANDMAAASAVGQVPVFVVYNIPGRDCGGDSGGGATDPTAYDTWVSNLAAGLGDGKAVLVIEPDSLGLACLTSRPSTYQMISFAVNAFDADPNAYPYIGASNWVDPQTTATRLQQAGVAQARGGFAINVSSFASTASQRVYGDTVSGLLGGAHYVVDTSRNTSTNPAGWDGQWCNPPDQTSGPLPTTATGDAALDALLWIKTPGQSDGTCNGGPPAGQFWPKYALTLARSPNL